MLILECTELFLFIYLYLFSIYLFIDIFFRSPFNKNVVKSNLSLTDNTDYYNDNILLYVYLYILLYIFTYYYIFIFPFKYLSIFEISQQAFGPNEISQQTVLYVL